MAGKQPLLAGKAGMVTGGGSGMGRSAALALAAEGAEVLLVGRRAEPLEAACAEIAASGGTAHAFAAVALAMHGIRATTHHHGQTARASRRNQAESSSYDTDRGSFGRAKSGTSRTPAPSRRRWTPVSERAAS